MIIKKSDIPQLLLNNITGKIGGIIIRRRYGKTIISAASAGYRKSNSEQSVGNRKRFAVVSKISKALNDIPEFKEFWICAAKNKMSSFNAVAKFIAKQVGKDGVAAISSIFPAVYSKMMCTPETRDISRFSIKVDYSLAKDSTDGIGFIKENMRGKEKSLFKEMNPGNQIYIRIISLFMMTGSEFSPDKYIVISSDFHKIDDNKNELIVVTNFFDSYISMMSEYNHIDVRYVAVLYDCKKRMMYISGTHSIDGFFKS